MTFFLRYNPAKGLHQIIQVSEDGTETVFREGERQKMGCLCVCLQKNS